MEKKRYMLLPVRLHTHTLNNFLIDSIVFIKDNTAIPYCEAHLKKPSSILNDYCITAEQFQDIDIVVSLP